MRRNLREARVVSLKLPAAAAAEGESKGPLHSLASDTSCSNLHFTGLPRNHHFCFNLVLDHGSEWYYKAQTSSNVLASAAASAAESDFEEVIFHK